MTVISRIVDELIRVSLPPHGSKKISRLDYERWAREFVFEGLKDQRYGQSFCNYFNITDNILYFSGTVEEADRYILKHYVK